MVRTHEDVAFKRYSGIFVQDLQKNCYRIVAAYVCPFVEVVKIVLVFDSDNTCVFSACM